MFLPACNCRVICGGVRCRAEAMSFSATQLYLGFQKGKGLLCAGEADMICVLAGITHVATPPPSRKKSNAATAMATHQPLCGPRRAVSFSPCEDIVSPYS